MDLRDAPGRCGRPSKSSPVETAIYPARYLRLPRWLTELAVARGDGRYRKLLASSPASM